ncbi:MAG: phosphate/phosphite/phosphonate ABC transporter substrate-binding protein [Alphaproteobacteria bacterium]|nr:phosphate/phosphite/phosphonate ABC transporter substrate-binding protein [Alphaproteobacteria bacterium]
MLPRRHLLALVATGPLLAGMPASRSGAHAQGDWRSQVREIRFGISSAENERDAVARHEPLARYLSEKLGVPVRIYRATDYAGVVEAMRAGHLEFARIGPANYALAYRIMGSRIAPIARDIDQAGAEGYYSVIAVKADSPFRTLADLRGRAIAWPDPNSASGFAVPAYYLRKEGIDIERFFGRTGFSGSHEQGIIAILNGTFDAAATFWSNEARGNIQRMTEKGMIPAGATRIIWRSPLIPNSPWVVRTDLPAGLLEAYRAALFAMPSDAPDVFRLASTNARGLAPTKHEDYLDVIAVTEENQRQRRQRRS